MRKKCVSIFRNTLYMATAFLANPYIFVTDIDRPRP